MRNRSTVVYFSALLVLCFLNAIFGPVRNPFGNQFFRVVVPGLVLLNSFQWLVLPLNLRAKFIGVLGSLLAGLLFISIYTHVDFPDFATLLILGMFVQGAILWTFATARGERSIIAVQPIAIAFVVLIGLYIQRRGIGSQLGESSLGTVGFLFWSPLMTLTIWAGVVAFGRSNAALVVLICGVVQVGIGLFDLGTAWNVAWGLPCAVIVWFLGLGVGGYLAKTWNSPVQG